MHARRPIRSLLALSAAAALMGAVPAGAATQLQGYYENYIQGNRGDETWQLEMPRHYFELRVLTTPWKDIEGFLKTGVESNRFRNDTGEGFFHDPEFLFGEGHIKMRGARSEVLFFSRQNRFWFSQPLLQVIDGNKFWGSRAVRVDFWETFGFQGMMYYGDQTTSSIANTADDFAVTRITRPLLQRRILFGGTFGRVDFGTDTAQYGMTGALDAELALGELIGPLERFGRATFVVEAARNFSGSQEFTSISRDRNGIQAELRDMNVNALQFKLNGWYREPGLYSGRLTNRTGDDDRKGVFAEAYYRLPRKQIDLRYSHWRETSFEDRFTASGDLFEQNEHKIEAYAELKGGFSSWIKWRRYYGNRDRDFQEFRNIVLEVQGQNKLISVRPQVRFRDYGTPFEVAGYGMEINFNATSQWKFFARFLNAEENTESRRTIFLQARYGGFQDAEFFVEYGDGGRSDRLTENDGFISEGPSATDQDGERRVAAILKYWF